MQQNNVNSRHRRAISFHSESLSPRITPRSPSTTPRSPNSSPRKKLLNLLKPKQVDGEQIRQKALTDIQLYDEQNRPLGKNHYELFSCAIKGDMAGVKRIIDSGEYTRADLEIIGKFAGQYDQFAVVSLFNSLK